MEKLTGYKDYRVRLFQKNLPRNYSKEIKLHHGFATTDYTIIDVREGSGSVDMGRKECAAYALMHIRKMKPFFHKHDALQFKQGIQDLVYVLQRFVTPNVDKVEMKLQGNDKEGYYFSHTIKYLEEDKNETN